MLTKILKVITVLHLTWIFLTVTLFITLYANKDLIPSAVSDAFVVCIQCGFGIIVTSAIALGFGIKLKHPFLIMVNAITFPGSSGLSVFVWILADAMEYV